MQYREKLLDLLANATEEELVQWIKNQPLIYQPDILREFAEMVKEMIIKKGDDNNNLKAVEEFYKCATEYEESILDEQLAILKYEMAVKDRDEHLEKCWQHIDSIRADIKQGIAMNLPHADDLKKIAGHYIEYEKRKGVYDPLNWIGIE